MYRFCAMASSFYYSTLLFFGLHFCAALYIPSTSENDKNSTNVCTDRACVVRAGRLMNAIDTSIDPCENFVQYACGGRFRGDFTLGLDTSLGMAYKEDRLIEKKLEKLLEDTKRKRTLAELKAHQFLEICKRSWFSKETAIDLIDQLAVALGVPELYQKPHGPSVPKKLENYGELLQVLRKDFGVIFAPSVLRLRDNGKCMNTIQLDIGKIFDSIGDDYDLEYLDFFKDEEEQRDLEIFYNQLNDLSFEKCPNHSYTATTLQKLIESAPEFGWPHFLNLPADSNETLEVGSCIPNLARQLAAIEKEYPKEIRKVLIAVATKKLWNRRDSDDVDKNCEKITTRFFGEVFTYSMINKEELENLEEVRLMAEELKIMLHKRLAEADWLYEDARNIYKDKLESIRVFIGYPDFLKSSESLEEFLEPLILTGKLPEDFMAMARWRDAASSNTCDLDVWDEMPSLEVNAVNSRSVGSVIMSLAMMRAESYDQRLPSVFRYANTGMTLGHEFMHCFDNDGRLFDRWGNDFIINETLSEYFDNAETCLTDYYDSIKNKGVHVKGDLTLGENIADVFGLQIAYEAWIAHRKNIGHDEKTLPGVEFTPEQLFFISFAQANCDDEPKSRLQFSWDEHAPGYARVVGSIEQTQYFSDAFNCPTNKKHNIKNRCELW